MESPSLFHGSDRRRLQALVADRNASQKHVWRAEIVLLTADGLGTNEIMRRTAKSKTCVWRWRCLRLGRRSAGRHRSLRRRTQYQAEALHLDR